jgi:RNA polymerase sigma factor (TIGR02999 family)
MSEITRLLREAGDGDVQASEQVMALLYADLQRLARSRMRRSGEITLLDTTALVHESFLRMQGAGSLDFGDRKHFLAYASQVMHTIVIDLVRARRAERRGGDVMRVTLNTSVSDSVAHSDDELLRVHEALEELLQVDPRLGQVVQMRFFAGLSEREISECLGVTERTVQRDWQKARMFLAAALSC